MPGVVLAKIIYRNDSCRSLNRFDPWRIPTKLPASLRIQSNSSLRSRSSFIGARRVNLSPTVFHLPRNVAVAVAFRSDKPLVMIVSGRYVRGSLFNSLPSGVDSGVEIELHPLPRYELARSSSQWIAKRETVAKSVAFFLFLPFDRENCCNPWQRYIFLRVNVVSKGEI